MYKQVARVLAAVLLLCAPAFGQVTFSKDVAPIAFRKCAQCHHPGGSAPFSLLTYSSARSHATQMALLTKSRVDAAVESGPIRAQVHRIGSIDGCRDRNLSALGRRGRARRQSARFARRSSGGSAAGSSARPTSSSPSRSRTCWRPMAPTSHACSSCLSLSIGSATFAASSSAPTTRGFIMPTSASIARRRRASSTSRIRRRATTASSCDRRFIQTDTFSDGRQVRPLLSFRRASRGIWHPAAISCCRFIWCLAENPSPSSRRLACTSPTIRPSRLR